MNEIELIRSFRSDLPSRSPAEVQRQRAALLEAIGGESDRGLVARARRLRIPRRRALAGALAVLLVPAAAVAGVGIVGDGAPPEKAEPVRGTDAPSGLPVPRLGAEREARALEVIEGDERAQRFLAGRDFEFTQSGPWTSDRQGLEVFGAILDVRLDERASYPQQKWPVVEPAPALDPPYRERTLPMAVDDVGQLTILVDLRRERVVSVEPVIDDAVQITPGQGFPTNPPTGE